jgi:pectin lyase
MMSQGVHQRYVQNPRPSSLFKPLSHHPNKPPTNHQKNHQVGGADTANVVVHAVNNYFHNNLGHDFDVAEGGNALIEGNVFSSVTTPITAASASSGGQLFNVYSTSYTSTCTSSLGRACQMNSVSGSGTWSEYTTSGFLVDFSGKNVQAATAYSSVVSSVTNNAGIGRIGN